MKWSAFGRVPMASILCLGVLAPAGVMANHQGRGVARDGDSCHVTTAQAPLFIPPAPYPPKAGHPRSFWFGHERLWTQLSVDGTWSGLPRNPSGLRQKVFWWHPGFDGRAEPVPDLTVSGRRLDGSTLSFVHATAATNAHHVDFGGWAMLTGIDVPTGGCWELTAQYRGETLTFVVWITG